MTDTAAAPDNATLPDRLTPRTTAISDRYEKFGGESYLTGLQALVRILFEHDRLDRRRGLDTRTLVSGYEGSPLAGYDLELQRQRRLLEQHHIVFRPSVNEELAVNAVQGSQLASVIGTATSDGVVGVWYGKAPGLDRSTDAIRHANLGGASPTGGVLALVGDDSVAKSSTVPSSSEAAMAEVGMTVLAPADPQDVLELGLHGIELSRFCGLWTGLKVATNVADGGMTVSVTDPLIEPVVPDNTVDGSPYIHEVTAQFVQPTLGRLERSALVTRPELALRYARANRLNRTSGDANASVGFIAAGATWLDTIEALRRCGVDPADANCGVRVLKLGMVSPLDHDEIRSFAAGLDVIVVVEEKRAFIELGVKDALYGLANAPRVVGRRGLDNGPFLRPDNDLPPEVIAAAVAPVLDRFGVHTNPPPVSPRPTAPTGPSALTMLPLLYRTPYFCSGCPHNRSTQAPAGSLVGAGIGCSALASFVDKERVGDIIGLCQMGGEGAAWVGMSPFVAEKHVFQNLGDGTYHHSGSLAVRAAVAAGVNITYKLLYNDTVAMTGGQDAIGKMRVPNIAAELLAEGVARVVITTEDLTRYRRVKLPAGVDVRHRDRLVATQEELAATPGVTVLIHDQECATELRRKRKRGLVADPTQRVFINERVCEGCGDCGKKSNCLSVQPVQTAFGRKTRIHQASCNKDYSCLDGDCPAFLTVEPGRGGVTLTPPRLDVTDLPAPQLVVSDTAVNIRLTGVGGTGVVTTSQVLANAAVIDGFFVRGLDQLGLAQKGGAVVSDLRITSEPTVQTNKVGSSLCDLYLACDLLVGASDANLATMSPERTVAVVDGGEVPTGSMVTRTDVAFPPSSRTLGAISARARRVVSADVRATCRKLFGDDQYANVFLIGMALQAGALPVSAGAIEAAIELNGVAVERNVQAFRWGRLQVADAAAVLAALPQPRSAAPTPTPLAEEIAALVHTTDPDLRDVVTVRVGELIGYQNADYARRYAEHVEEIRQHEATRIDAAPEVTRAVAINLHKLMAYKDEYEVARLSVDPALTDAVRAEFGPDATFTYRLHPPTLRSMGMSRKISLGPWFVPAFRALKTMKGLRGTAMDPFGRAAVRRVERALPNEYLDSVRQAMGHLTEETAGTVKEIAQAPDIVRGYEDIKLANVEKYRTRVGELLTDLKGYAVTARL